MLAVKKLARKVKHKLVDFKNILALLVRQEGALFIQKGYCHCCESETQFKSYHQWLRDHFRCTNCGSIPRQRALLKVLEDKFPDWRHLVIHESSPDIGGASERLRKKCAMYSSSHYFPDQPLGKTINGYRNENLESLTIEDESIDIFISQDVMEHVYDANQAFSEISRVLRPGGAHIFTVPIINKHKKTKVWATKKADGTPSFLHTPEYHGNPIDPKGSPVTMHWGYDIVSHIREASGMDTEIIHIDDLNLGIRAEYIEVLITTKL